MAHASDDWGPVSDRENDGDGEYSGPACPECGATRPSDCQCAPEDESMDAKFPPPLPPLKQRLTGELLAELLKRKAETR